MIHIAVITEMQPTAKETLYNDIVHNIPSTVIYHKYFLFEIVLAEIEKRINAACHSLLIILYQNLFAAVSTLKSILLLTLCR